MNKKNIAVGVVLFLLGLLVMIFPLFWIKVAVITLGLAAIAYGIYSLVGTKKLFENSKYEKTILIKSIISIITGLLAVVLPLAIAGIMWNIMIYILVVYMIISAVLGFYSVSLLNDTGIDRKRYIVENSGLLLGAIILLLIPSKSLGPLLIRIIGLGVMIAGIICCLFGVFAGKKIVLKKAKPADDATDDSDVPDISAETEKASDSPEETEKEKQENSDTE